MGHPRIPEHQIAVFWEAITDGYTVRQAAQLAGLTYQQGRYVKAVLHADGKRGNSYQYRYALQRQQAFTLLAQGVSRSATARIVGVAPKTIDAWRRAAHTTTATPRPNAEITPTDPPATPVLADRPTDGGPVDRRASLWSRPPRVSVPPVERHDHDSWSVDWADD